jgi:hypothetical protein
MQAFIGCQSDGPAHVQSYWMGGSVAQASRVSTVPTKRLGRGHRVGPCRKLDVIQVGFNDGDLGCAEPAYRALGGSEPPAERDA